MKINFFPVLVFTFALGIWFGEHTGLVLAVLAALFVFASIFTYLIHDEEYKKIAFVAVFFLLGTGWGRGDAIQGALPLQIKQPLTQTLILRVLDEPRQINKSTQFTAEVLANPLNGQKAVVWLKDGDFLTKGESGALQRGSVLKVHGTLNLIEPPRNPGQFDFRKYYHIRGIDYRIDANAVNVQVIGYKRPNFLLRLSDYLRMKANETALSFGNTQAAAIFAAMISGDKSLLNDENILLFQNLGLMHLFAISGLHVGIVVALFYYLARRLKMKPLVEFLLLAGILFVYAGVAGFAMSVLRAVIMALFYAFAKVISKNTAPLIPLALAAMVLLAFSPRYIDDLGFLLTFGCVLGLILFEGLLAEAGIKKLLIVFLIPIFAQLLVLPLILSNFHVFGWGELLMSIPAALLSLPMVLAAFVLIIFAPLFPFLAQAAAAAGILCAEVLLASAQFVNKMPYATMHFPSPPWYLTVVFYFIIMVVYFYSYGKGKVDAKRAVRILVLLPLLLLIPFPRNELKVTFIDVGQGDAILAELPDGRNILVDGGGLAVNPELFDRQEYDVGMKVVLPVLYSKGIDRLDYIFATHPHADHIGGLPAVIHNLRVDKMYCSPYENEAGRTLESEAKSLGIHTRKLENPLRIDSGEIKITVLPPLKKYNGTHSDANNSSLVLKISYLGRNILLTGDIEEEAMQDFARAEDWHDITFLKAPHHGSKFSLNKAFLEETFPAVVIASVGKHNTFGHPAQEVISYWHERDVPFLRTDEDGAVEIVISKANTYVDTVLSRKLFRLKS